MTTCTKCPSTDTMITAICEVRTGHWLGPFVVCKTHVLTGASLTEMSDVTIDGDYIHHVLTADEWLVISTMQR